MAEVNNERLEQSFGRLQAHPMRNPLLDRRFRELIVSADDDALNRINARKLALAWGIPTNQALTWLIYASQVGLFSINWESHCLHCTGMMNFSQRLGALGQAATCKLCLVESSIHADHNVEVTFSLSPAIRETRPSLKVFMPHYVQQLGQYDARQPFTLRFDSPLEYFLIDAGAGLTGGIAKFEVSKEAAPLQEVAVTFHPESASPSRRTLGPGTTTINTRGVPSVIAVSRDVSRISFDSFVTGSDVMLLPDFKNVFSQVMLSQRESLSIRNLTILFTDITGSTALYQRLGDVRAYNLVRDHFDVLFKQIEEHGGVVVKTIGDAVMAAFPAPDYGLQAALAVQRDIRQFNERRSVDQGIILVKIGLHAGNAIAVNLNNTLDYFGNMVNQAARIQGKSRSEEVLLSEAVYNDAGVQKTLAARPDLVLSDSVFELQGIGEHRLYSVLTRLSTTGER